MDGGKTIGTNGRNRNPLLVVSHAPTAPCSDKHFSVRRCHHRRRRVPALMLASPDDNGEDMVARRRKTTRANRKHTHTQNRCQTAENILQSRHPVINIYTFVQFVLCPVPCALCDMLLGRRGRGREEMPKPHATVKRYLIHGLRLRCPQSHRPQEGQRGLPPPHVGVLVGLVCFEFQISPPTSHRRRRRWKVKKDDGRRLGLGIV